MNYIFKAYSPRCETVVEFKTDDFERAFDSLAWYHLKTPFEPQLLVVDEFGKETQVVPIEDGRAWRKYSNILSRDTVPDGSLNFLVRVRRHNNAMIISKDFSEFDIAWWYYCGIKEHLKDGILELYVVDHSIALKIRKYSIGH